MRQVILRAVARKFTWWEGCHDEGLHALEAQVDSVNQTLLMALVHLRAVSTPNRTCDALKTAVTASP